MRRRFHRRPNTPGQPCAERPERAISRRTASLYERLFLADCRHSPSTLATKLLRRSWPSTEEKNLRGSFLIASAVGLIAGCVPTYREVANSTPSSTLTFEKGYTVGTGLGRSALQEYWIVEDEACQNPQRAAWFTWANDPAETRRVLADRQVHIVARTKFYEGSGGTSSSQPGATVNISECRSLAQFTPELGRAYSVVHKATPRGSCDLVILNAGTNSPPRDLRVSDPAPCAEDAIP